MTYVLSDLSRRRLKGVHPDLVALVEDAIRTTEIDFLVVEGCRTKARQRKLVSAGKSTTMNSRHLTGHAVDLCAIDGKTLHWGAPHHDIIANAMKEAASERGIDLEWGGDWKTFVDPPHFQLSWKSYPKQETSWQSTPASTQVAKKATKAPVSAVGGAAGLVAVLTGYVETAFTWLKGVAVYLTDLTPVKTLFVQAGANLQALTIGGIIIAGTVVAKRMLEDDD